MDFSSQKRVMAWLKDHQCSVERPLFYWKKKDILALCRKHNVLNPLYDMGFERVGCFPCIMENKAGIKNIADRFPEQIRIIAEAERRIGRSFFPYTKTPPRYGSKPTIRDVVRWARSQAPAEMEALKCNDNAGSCMSHYQQCE
ncbi:phosphoadenosine phosphosulfate reductase family protein [Candidatus Woesearchaeota archaeon]|nr:phosphoadenosine phosphosulfate reductase family protein [Candidatus Woesearchaeota archaeon]